MKKLKNYFLIFTITGLSFFLMFIYPAFSIVGETEKNDGESEAEVLGGKYMFVITNHETGAYIKPDKDSDCLSVIPQATVVVMVDDKIPGWTRVLLDTDKEGYVDSSRLDIFMDPVIRINEVSVNEAFYNPDENGTILCGGGINRYSVSQNLMYGLEAKIKSYENRLGFMLYDIESGMSVSYNANGTFYSASTIKAANALFIYENIDNGTIDPLQEISYEARHATIDTGVMRYGDFGDKYTVLQVLNRSIYYSDNSAYYMLLEHFGIESFNEFIESLGCSATEKLDENKKWVFTTPADTVIIWKEIYRYIHKSENGNIFLQDLVKSQNRIIADALPEYTVAHKYGWSGTYYNDTAIVYAERPYILSVFTESSGGYENRRFIKELTLLLDEIMDEYNDWCKGRITG